MAEKAKEGFVHLQWSVADVNSIIPGSGCLIDAADSWTEETSVTREEILDNERLRSLIKKPRNRIVALPDQRATARFFYCGCCGDIPFPWTRDPEASGHVQRSVYLCRRGHPMCRTCYRLRFGCTFSMQDYVNVYNLPPTIEALKQHTTPGDSQNSMRDWGRVRLCSEKKTIFKGGFMNEMISYTEFACKYFYNWCEFRGRGQILRVHEETCKHQPFKELYVGKSEDEESDKPKGDPPETAILNFDLKGTCEEAPRLALDLKEKHGDGDKLNTGSIPLHD